MKIDFSSKEVNDLIELFGVRTDSVKPVEIDGLHAGTRVYSVDHPGKSQVYLIDSLAAMRIGCHPSVVGEELDGLALEAAYDAVHVIKSLDIVQDVADVAFENVLRAAPGYELHKMFSRFGTDFRQVYIRPRYRQKSYRDHEGAVTKELYIDNENFRNFPRGRKSLVLMKPDTEASGRTSEMVIPRTVEVAKDRESEIKSLVLYGYISERGLELVEKVCESVGIEEIYALCMGNLTALCRNNYDMPFYGPDVKLWEETGEIQMLGSVAARETIERYATEFIPGSDQPGDWSARQSKVFNGIINEIGDISGHLKNSIDYLGADRTLLMRCPSLQYFNSRFGYMAEIELTSIEEQLENIQLVHECNEYLVHLKEAGLPEKHSRNLIRPFLESRLPKTHFSDPRRLELIGEVDESTLSKLIGECEATKALAQPKKFGIE